MSTHYWFKCTQCEEQGHCDWYEHYRLAPFLEVWKHREKIVAAVDQLEALSISPKGGAFVYDDVLVVDVDFLREHGKCKVVVHDEYGRDFDVETGEEVKEP